MKYHVKNGQLMLSYLGTAGKKRLLRLCEHTVHAVQAKYKILCYKIKWKSEDLRVEPPLR